MILVDSKFIRFETVYFFLILGILIDVGCLDEGVNSLIIFCIGYIIFGILGLV